MEQTPVLKSIFSSFAGFMEIGGGYLVWLWFREKWGIGIGLIGALLLVGYGIVPTLQPANFGRVYGAYGGVFVIMSPLWGRGIDGIRPDIYDTIGGLLCLIGVGIIMYAPR